MKLELEKGKGVKGGVPVTRFMNKEEVVINSETLEVTARATRVHYYSNSSNLNENQVD
jgi:hypothetical protein